MPIKLPGRHRQPNTLVYWMASHRRLVMWGSIILIAIFLLEYVVITNNVSTQGYRLNALQQQIQVATQQNQSLQLDIMAAVSLPRVQSAAKTISLGQVQNIEYLAANGSAVAVR